MPDTPPAEDPLFGNPASDLLRGALEEAKSTTSGAPWEPPAPEELETLLPQYEIECMLGRGGMGAVYKGRQLSLDRPVAIKILSNHLASADASFASRFKNEARAMAKLSHPGIVAVYDFGEAINGLLYIVMEFVEGTDVARMIVTQGRLHSEHAMAITAHVCDALAYAHERGIIHRDIKPANIMLRNDGVVKVADFGLAKFSASSGETLGLTQSGMAMGTPHFVAPEALILGVTLDQRADIYAVGVMLYQMLTGKLPQGLFELPSLQIPGLDPRYDGIIGKALREDREVRYPSVLDMRRDLDAILTQPVVKVEADAEKAPAALTTRAHPQRASGPPQRPPSSLPRPAPPPQSSSSGLVAAVVLVVAGAAALFFLVMDRPAPTDSSAQPQPEAENGMSPLAQSPEATPSSTDPVQATKEKPFVNTLDMKFVPVPGTEVLFCIHETRKADYAAYAAGNDAVDASWKNPNYRGIPVSSGGDHPVCNVSWNDATAFCDWLSKKEQRRYRLPTDREWSMAVGIGDREDASLTPGSLNKKVPGQYTWGTQWPPPKGAGNYADTAAKEVFPEIKTLEGYTDGFATSAPVMSLLPNTLGIYDLGGNVWEFCGDFFDKAQTMRTVRGGCWGDGGDFPRPFSATGRNGNKPGDRHYSRGFRCVLEMTDAAYSPPPRPDASAPSESSDPTKDQPFVNTLGMKFVPVPGTDVLFCIHETRKADYAAFFAATPGVPAFWQNPIYEGQPVSFANDHPVCNIRWQDCQDFCQWLSRKEGRTYRLPTDREWSFAVGIGDREDASLSPHLLSDRLTGEFPWGKEWPPPAGAGNLGDSTMAAKFPKKRPIPGYTDGFATTAPVMSFSPNRFGLYDLSGNIWEFCQDWYDETRTKYVIRGLNFDDSGESSVRFLSSHRGWCPVGNRHSNFGFRLVLERAAKRAADGGAAAVSSASSSAPPTDPMTWTDLRDSFNAARETRAALPTGPTTWTDTKGRSLTATFKAIASGNVLLDIAGKTTPVPLNTLSAESQKLAQQMDAARQRAEASDPAKATKDQPFVNSLGMKFVPVPITGGSTGGKRVLFSIWETRVQDYEVFVQDTRRAWGSPEFPQGPTHPAVMVSWADARAFAEWLTARERQAGKSPASTVYRLPTDHEWSCAAGIGDLEQADLIPEEKFQGLPGIYPWGQQWPPPSGAGNFWSEELRPLVGQPGFNHFKGELPGYKDGAAATAAVGSYLPNALGLYDVSGNVWEWCEDWFNPQQRYKVQRGGSWNGNNEDGMLTSHRHTRPPQEAPNGVGFRLVLELDAKPASASPAVPVIPSSTSTATRNSPEMTALLEFERKLRSHTWVIPDRNWELRFENNHRAPIDEKVYTTRWHWWITGPRSLHVQFAAAPAAYDPNIGAEYIFDKNMKGFTNGAGKPTGVRGSALAAPAESDLGRSLAPDYAPKLGGGLPSQFPSL